MNAQGSPHLFRPVAWTGALLCAVWFAAPLARAQMAAPSLDPTAALSGSFGEVFDLRYDGTFTTVFDEATKQVESFLVRRNVRVISTDLSIQCDTLENDALTGKLIATPALGERVEIVYGGVRAECGLFEYYPGRQFAILRRRPVIFQTDETGAEFETTGHVIYLSRRKDGAADVLVKSKDETVQKVEMAQPATLVLDQDAEAEPPTGMTLPELHKSLTETSREIVHPEDLENIEVDIRKETDERP